MYESTWHYFISFGQWGTSWSCKRGYNHWVMVEGEKFVYDEVSYACVWRNSYSFSKWKKYTSNKDLLGEFNKIMDPRKTDVRINDKD